LRAGRNVVAAEAAALAPTDKFKDFFDSESISFTGRTCRRRWRRSTSRRT